jgi:D-alanine-D-alanine ligase-like ATP-grasp enzyme
MSPWRAMGRRLLAMERLIVGLRKKWLDWTGRSGQVYFHHRVAEYREMWRVVAEELGGKFTSLADDLWEIEVGSVRTRMHNHQTEFDNPAVLGLAGDKAAVHRLLGGAGLSVPQHAVFSLSDLERAYRFHEAQPKGCVVKPANGYGGQGVTTHVQHTAEVRKAAILASLYDSKLLIEAQIPGESYRLLILEGKMVHAVCRRGPRLKGDGVSPVRRLIEAENSRLRGSGHSGLDLDRDCLFTLANQSLSPDSIAAEGKEFLVKSVNDTARKYSEVRTVYNETVTDLVCESLRKDAECAARLVGSDFLGVDVITTDPAVPLHRSGGVINEVNTTPALHHHYDLPLARYPEAALHVVRALLRRKTPAVTGTR